MKYNREFLLFICIFSFFIAEGSVSVLYGSGNDRPSTIAPLTLEEVSGGFVCQCGCGMTLLNCNHIDCPSGVPMRKQIVKEIEAGRTEGEIVKGFVQEYGEVVLAAPPKSGFNLSVWVAPFIALFLGVVLITFLLVKWSRRRSALSPTPESSQELDSSYLARVERDLQKGNEK